MRLHTYLQRFFLVSAVAVLGVTGTALPARAAVQNPSAQARVSFTFDDSYASIYTQAAPTLKHYGLTGTSYAITGCIGMTTVPNTCPVDDTKTYMTWAQLQAVQNQYGWEIGSHTVNHPLLVSTDPVDQPIALTPAQVDYQLSQSKADLTAHGIAAKSFASPYGDYNPRALSQIAKYYQSHRGFADTGYNTYPYSDYLVRDQQVQVGVTPATVKGYIDQAIANKTWLVLTFHDIKTKPNKSAGSYDYATADLAAIASYVQTKQAAGVLKQVNVTQGTVTSDINMWANGSFNSALGVDWTTDNPAAVTVDTAGNGSYPDPSNSVRLAPTTVARLYSPKVAVDAANLYAMKTYINVAQLTSGEVNFYIDEFDANGTWVSGQNKASERSVWAESMNFTYQPTSSLVKYAQLQVTSTANSGIVAYVDNAQMFALSSVQTPPAQTNLVANGTFDAGIASGWRTDNTATITTDSNNNGALSNPMNSVKLTSSTTASSSHLFSPQVAITAGKTYTISSYLDLRQITSSEVGFYVDEYSSAGTWISGRYITAVRTVSKGSVSITYTPSTSSVAKASLQVIVPGNAGILAYFDNVTWYQN